MVIWFQKTGMQILLWLLGIVDSIFEVFKVTAGITPLKGDQTITEYIMSQSPVVHMFLVVLIASVAICGVCAIVGIIKGMSAVNAENKSPGRTIAQSMSTLLVSLGIGAILLSGITVTEGLLKQVDRAMNEGREMIMSHEIIDVSVSGLSIEYDTENILELNIYDKDNNPEYISPLYAFQYDKETKEPVLFEEFKGYEGVKPIVYMTGDPHTGMDPISKDRLYEINDKTGKLEFKKSTPDEKCGRDLLVAVKSNNGYYTNYRTGDNFSKLDIREDIWDESVTHLFGEYKSVTGFPTEWIAPAPTSSESGWQKTLSVIKNIIFIGGVSDIVDKDRWESAVADTPGIIRPDNFNFVVAYLTTIIMAVTLIGASLGLVKRVFDIVFLFITLPGIAATIPMDDGAKFKLWRETVISKLFLAYGTVLAVNIFFLVAPSLWGIEAVGTLEGMKLTVLKVFLVCGGALSVSGAQLLMSRLLGTSAEESREMMQSARTLMAGTTATVGASRAAGRAVFGTKNAYGQRVGGLIKGGASVAGSIGLGAVNTAGSFFGGQAYRHSKLGRGVTATQRALKGFGGSSGWFGTDRTTGGNTLGGAIGSGINKGFGKFADSGAARKVGLDRGVGGAVHKFGQFVGSRTNMKYSTKLDKESQARSRANDIAEAFGVSPYTVKHVKEKKKKE